MLLPSSVRGFQDSVAIKGFQSSSVFICVCQIPVQLTSSKTIYMAQSTQARSKPRKIFLSSPQLIAWSPCLVMGMVSHVMLPGFLVASAAIGSCAAPPSTKTRVLSGLACHNITLHCCAVAAASSASVAVEEMEPENLFGPWSFGEFSRFALKAPGWDYRFCMTHRPFGTSKKQVFVHEPCHPMYRHTTHT
jgi:hypothetical protein